MLVTAMATGEMGMYRLDHYRIHDSCCAQTRFSSIGSSNFPPSILVVFPLDKNPKRKKTWRLGLRVLNSGGGSDILEKESEFKPAFGEYLKAMEAISERRQARQSSRPKRGDGSMEKAGSEEGLRLVKKGEVFKATESRKKMSAETDVEGRRRKVSEITERSETRARHKSATSTSSSSSSKVFVDNGNNRKVTIRNRSEAEMGRKEAGRVAGTVSSNFGLLVGGNGVTREVEGARKGRSSKVFIDEEELDVERAAFRNFDESSGVVDKPRVSQAEMEERIQKLARSLNGADIDIPEWMFSRMMRNAKIKFMDYSMLRVVQVLGKLGNWRRVLQVIEWLQMRERYKSHKLRNILTTALIVLKKARRPVEALNLFQTMQQQVSSYPDMVTYHAIAITLGQAGYLKELFDVIDTMRSHPKIRPKTNLLGKWDPRLEPDIVVYHAVLNACAQWKQWEGAFWVLQQLKLKGQPPSSVTYGLVMEVMFSCGKYSLVHEFFRKIQKSAMPNALTYRVLMNTLWKEGKIDEAVSTVQDMEKRGIVGSAALYYDLARCLCSAGRCKEALMQIEKLCKVASKPLVVTYTGLIQACLDSGNIRDGAYIFTEMQKFCSPNLVTFNIMLKAYLEHGLFDEAKDLFQKMSDEAIHISSKSDYKHRVVPDIHSFNLMLDACVEQERWDEFELTYDRMLQCGYHFNPKRHLHMVLDAARAGKGEALEKTWEDLSRASRVPPPALVKERFCIKLENDDHESALLSLTSHSLSESSAFSRMAWMKLMKENSFRFREETVMQLVHELHILVARSESQNLVLQNLLVTVKEFLRSHFRRSDVFVKASLCTPSSISIKL